MSESACPKTLRLKEPSDLLDWLGKDTLLPELQADTIARDG